MSVNWDVTIIPGGNENLTKTWYVGARTIFGEAKHYSNNPTPEHGEIIIPICQLEGMSAEQVGESVLSLLPTARTCFANHVAEEYADLDRQGYFVGARDEFLESMIYEDLPLLKRHRNDEHANPDYFESAIGFLRLVKARHEASRGERPSVEIHAARKAINRNYNAIFMRIGRRDGFRCGACPATTDLQIDHVLPVSRGGGSEDENLQLLCGSCNSSKGTKTIDYRVSAVEVSV